MVAALADALAARGMTWGAGNAAALRQAREETKIGSRLYDAGWRRWTSARHRTWCWGGWLTTPFRYH